MSGIVQQMLMELQNHQRRTYPEYSGPVVHAYPNFNACADAAALDKAIKEKGVNEGIIIDILTNRSNAQRQEIKAAYKQVTGKSLEEDLKKALSGNCEVIIVGLLKTPAQFDAHELKKAMKGLGTDEQALIDIIVPKTNREMKQINAVYKEEYKTDLSKDIASETSGDFRNILLALCKGVRNEDVRVNEELADKDARALYDAGEKIKSANASVFIEIFASRSPMHLQRVFQNYSKISKHDVGKALDLEFKGEIENCLVAILKCASSKPAFFADRLFEAMKGSGTNDKELIRILVSRCEIDMKEIKALFKRFYGRSLHQAILDETKGDYEKCLLGLVGHD
ncbi:annexin A1-like isoform X2 [Ambystoma mexicanum]